MSTNAIVAELTRYRDAINTAIVALNDVDEPVMREGFVPLTSLPKGVHFPKLPKPGTVLKKATAPARRGWTMSAAARKKLSDAAKARWKKAKKAGKSTL